MSSREKFTAIGVMKPGMKNLNAQFIVVDKLETTKLREGGLIHHFVVADGSAAIHLSIWGLLGEAIRPGDILRLLGGWSSLHNGFLHLYMAKTGKLNRVGHFTMLFTETPNLSLTRWPTNDPSLQSSTDQQIQHQHQHQQMPSQPSFSGQPSPPTAPAPHHQMASQPSQLQHQPGLRKKGSIH